VASEEVFHRKFMVFICSARGSGAPKGVPMARKVSPRNDPEMYAMLYGDVPRTTKINRERHRAQD